MTRQRTRRDKGFPPKPGEGGFALVYMAVFITFLLIATGLAVDGGRAYVVKAQLTKAVDGAALSAARNLNSGSPRSRGGEDFPGQFPGRLHGDVLGDEPDHRCELLRYDDRSPRPASTS